MLDTVMSGIKNTVNCYVSTIVMRLAYTSHYNVFSILF